MEQKRYEKGIKKKGGRNIIGMRSHVALCQNRKSSLNYFGANFIQKITIDYYRLDLKRIHRW